ncbi:hypothetical protein QTP70_025920 [Hemibagrus guttatus]|uniref:Calponin-homology (CH) domain-containing protein n=1 Tax=Hemibagrus guttatus TaxID=175788 RepID=A0AAE0QTE5_9TELE|nr:hypothetical protein QTP70_025920 [Hemibagrus guttatus]
MDTGPALVLAGEGSPEGETVCAALARYETTLHDAVREIHVDVSAFKLGVERRLEEALHMSGPLGRAVAQLQQENRQLRSQLEALTRQVEMLTGTVCDRSALLGSGSMPTRPQSITTVTQSPLSPSSATTPSGSASSPIATRFSSRATFSVSSKNNSIEREEPIEVDPAPAPSKLENGHTTTAENSTVSTREICPPTGVSQQNSSHMAMPHLPITATTKIADSSSLKSPESPSSPMQTLPSVTETQPNSNPASSNNEPQLESPVHAVSSVKTWTPSPVRTMGYSGINEKMSSSAPSKSVAYSGYPTLNQHHTERNADIAGQMSFGRGMERKRELVRSQTLPRSIGAQARRSIFERLDSENSQPKPVDSKPKLKRSQSFGVSSASSIKQILLDWCRSKTIGYQNIDIQNFSSSWSDGMAFCALVHSFFPTEFDYNALSPTERKHNFELAFSTAEKKAGCDRLIEVEDMMVMGRKPDPM